MSNEKNISLEGRTKAILKTSIIGIMANIILAAFKAFIGMVSHSIAITLDAVNNLTDAISSIITIVGIALAGKEADKKHPFGYGRIEYLSTLAIAGIIIYTGITALVESVKSIFNPQTPDYSAPMLIVIAMAIFVKIFLGLFFIKKGKANNSDSLSASGKDALFDAVISVATIAAAVVYIITDFGLEAYLGIVISIVIIKAGLEILTETISKLLGEGADAQLVRDVKKAILKHEGVRGAYDLVFNNYGQDAYTASVHIEVPDTMTADELDVLSRHIMEDIHSEFGIFLTAIGIYSYNTANENVAQMRDKVSSIATAHEHIHQVHGFYVNFEEKKMRFDMVISFDADSRHELFEQAIAEVKKEFPEYDVHAGMDVDFNEI